MKYIGLSVGLSVGSSVAIGLYEGGGLAIDCIGGLDSDCVGPYVGMHGSS